MTTASTQLTEQEMESIRLQYADGRVDCFSLEELHANDGNEAITQEHLNDFLHEVDAGFRCENCGVHASQEPLIWCGRKVLCRDNCAVD